MRSFIKHYFISLLTLITGIISLNSCHSRSNKKDTPVTSEIKPPPQGNEKNISYLSVETLQSFIKLVPAFNISNKLKFPFDKLIFNKVIAYDFDGSEEPYPSVFDGVNKFIPIVEKQRALTVAQTKELIDLLTSTTTYGAATAACFNPHLAFVFFNNEMSVFKTDICLDCNYLNASEEIPAMHFKKIGKGTENEYSAIGFSEKGKSRIKQLARQLNFFYGEE